MTESDCFCAFIPPLVRTSVFRSLTITQITPEVTVVKRLVSRILWGEWREIEWCNVEDLKECLFFKFCEKKKFACGPNFKFKLF